MRESSAPVGDGGGTLTFCFPGDSLTKYTTAGTILGDVLKKFIPTVQAGKSVLDLCTE